MRRTLELANQLKVQTLALPSLGVGVFNIPKQLAANVYFEVLRSFFQNNPQTSIKSVKFVDTNAEMIRVLQNTLDELQLAPTVLETIYDTTLPKPKSINAQWYWQEDDGQFIPYDPDQNEQIELAYLEGKEYATVLGDRNRIKNNRIYNVFFKEMIQMNVETKYRRKVKREEKTPQQQSSTLPIPTNSQSSNNNTNQSQLTTVPQTIQIPISGLKEDVDKAKEELKNLLKKNKIQDSIASQLTPTQINELQQRCERNSVQGCYDPTQKLFIISGNKRNVKQAKNDCLEYLLRSKDIPYPQEWEPQSQNCELKVVPENSTEWQRVANRVKETMPQVKIIKIERVQNKWLWKSYYHNRLKMEEKNGKAVEAQLFHGTSSNDPSLIYNSETGFDMRFSNEGMVCSDFK
jgi:hypothetical protein